MLNNGGTSDRQMHVRVAIIGTGFAGLGLAIKLREAGEHDFVVFERADEVGGTWRDNTYPGCACDVPSNLYSFSFAQNPNWSRSFSPQPEILDYLRRCADRFGVRPHVRFGHEVQGADWDDEAKRWRIATSQGEFTAEFLACGMGPLSAPSIPDLPGLDTFEGTMFHSAEWNHDHDLTGERVAVVGTGASAIQFVPQIQARVGKLHLFQRTPPWIVPRNDRRFPRAQQWMMRRVPGFQRSIRAAIYWSRETFVWALLRPKVIRRLQGLALRHLAQQVPDSALRAQLKPDYTIGCKRILISSDYYPSLSQPNVELVPQGITAVRPGAVVAADGSEREVDTIIFGTGFHVTDPPGVERLRGRDGVSLAEAWKGGMSAYLGGAIHGFPNLFMLIGPNTGLGHTSMVVMIEAQLAYLVDCLRTMRARDLATVEVRSEVQAAYNADIQSQLVDTVWNQGGCRSWYLDDQGRNTTVWPTYTWRFRRRTRRFDPDAYLLTPRA